MMLKNGIEKLNEEDKEFMETYGKEIYFTDKNSIKELLEYCKKKCVVRLQHRITNGNCSPPFGGSDSQKPQPGCSRKTVERYPPKVSTG